MTDKADRPLEFLPSVEITFISTREILVVERPSFNEYAFVLQFTPEGGPCGGSFIGGALLCLSKLWLRGYALFATTN